MQIGLSWLFCNFLSNCNQAAQFCAVPCDPALGFPQVARDFSKSFPVIPQKGARNLLKKQSKVAFCHESCSKVVRESIFVQFWGITSVAKQLWLQLKPKKIVERTSSPETFKSRRVWIFVHHFEFSLKTAGVAAQLLLSCAHDLLQGGGFGSFFFFLQEIHKLSTKTLRNMEERPV